MSPAALESIALFTPLLASNAVFAKRRMDRGLDAMDDNKAYGIMNFDIAAGQVLKGARAIKGLSVASVGMSAMDSILGAANTAQKATTANKVLRGAGKIIDFTADHINPIICVASGVKVLGSDDKVDTALRESMALGCMFASEAAAKSIIGMPYFEKDKAGKVITKNREALYKKNPFVSKQVSAMKDFCETKKLFNKISLKAAPGIIKGALFVTASITGYEVGSKIANKVLGEQKTKNSTQENA